MNEVNVSILLSWDDVVSFKVRSHSTTIAVLGGCSLLSLALLLRDEEK